MKDKIKFCPQCNSCLFDDMMTCCVCGYQFTREDDEPVPLSAYDEVGVWDAPAYDVAEEDSPTPQNHVLDHVVKEKTMSMSFDCGDCVIDISVRPKARI